MGAGGARLETGQPTRESEIRINEKQIVHQNNFGYALIRFDTERMVVYRSSGRFGRV